MNAGHLLVSFVSIVFHVTAPPGAGAPQAPRASPARPAGRMVSIADFGATPDDSSDATDAIQAALLAGAGGRVLIPPGTFNIVPSRPLKVPSNTTIAGVGPQSVLKVSSQTGDYDDIFIGESVPAVGITFTSFRIDQ